MDIIRVAHGHSPDGENLTHKIRTESEWRSYRLKGRTSLYVSLTTDREDRYSEFHVYLTYERDRLKGWFIPYQESSDAAGMGERRRIDVSRPNLRTVVLAFPRRWLGRNVTSYGWSAYSEYREEDSKNCGREICRDDAPDGEGSGRIEHDLIP